MFVKNNIKWTENNKRTRKIWNINKTVRLIFCKYFWKTIWFFFSDGNCANMDKCKFCDISDIDLQSAWEMLNNLTQNRKYIVADFKNLQGIIIWNFMSINLLLCAIEINIYINQFYWLKKKFFFIKHSVLRKYSILKYVLWSNAFNS